MVQTTENLKQIFKYDEKWITNNDFQEEQDLIRNLLGAFDIGDTKMIECIKKAIDSKNTRNLINSNTKLADSNKKYQRALNWLTWWLVFVGLVQIIIQIFKK